MLLISLEYVPLSIKVRYSLSTRCTLQSYKILTELDKNIKFSVKTV